MTRGALFVDDFKGHSKENVKAYTRSLKSGIDSSPEMLGTCFVNGLSNFRR